MMEIVYDAHTFDSKQKIPDELIIENKKSIRAIYNLIATKLNLSSLDLIIVPEDYKTGLFEFQRKNGHPEGTTQNECRTGCAQVVASGTRNGTEIQNIVIDKNIALCCIDSLNIGKYLCPERYELPVATRTAFNRLHHEFAHVFERKLGQDVAWLQDEKTRSDLQSRKFNIAYHYWDEYFACRTSSKTYPLKSNENQEMVDTFIVLEKKIQETRTKLDAKAITWDVYISTFHNYASLILNILPRIHGDLYCLGDSRENAIKEIEMGLHEAKTGSIWREFETSMSELFETFPKWEDATVFDKIIELSESLYNDLSDL